MKNWLIAIVVAIALLAGGGYWWYTLQETDIASDPIDAIPKSAVLIISYPDINAVWDKFEEQDYYESIFPIAELQRYFSRNLLLDSLIRYDQNLKKTLSGSTIWSSYHTTETDSLLVFHAIEANGQVSNQLLKSLTASISGSGILSNISVNGQPGFKLVVKEPFYELFGTVTNGLILLSSSEALLSESISQLNVGKSLKNDDVFRKAVDVAGQNVEANVFINYSNAPAYLQKVLKPTLLHQEKLIADFASWTELDLNLNDNGFTLNGFTYTTDSLNQFLNLFLDQEPKSIDFPDYLPSNTASFIFFGISDLISFSADYREFLSVHGRLAKMESKLDSIEKKYGVDLEQNVLSWMGKAYGVCITEPRSSSFSEDTYWIFEARSAELAKKLLSDLSITVSKKNDLEIFKETISGIEFGQLKMGEDLIGLIGDGYQDFGSPFYMVIENYVVFGTSKEAMEQYIQYLQADRTLAKELSFSRFIENLSSSFNVFTYHHLARSENILQSYLNREAMGVLSRNKNALGKFEALGTQITSTGSSFYSNIFLRYDPEWEASEESSWKGQLDVEGHTTPKFVKNHVSNEYEVIVQDKKNQLYLFNLVGKQLFKRELPEPIESEIVQIDRYKNENLQYVFNTKNFIFMIDRNGKDVKGFPVELKSQAETVLSLVEYDNNRDYRLLITCKNKRIYNYEVDGTGVKGWRHNRAGDPTIHPFKHLFVKGKDYLITGESDGKIHLLDRRGKNRVKVEKYVPSSKNNHLEVFKSSNSKLTGIYITNKDGLVHRIALDGEVSTMNPGKFSPEHYFKVADLNGDGEPEFIFCDLNMLQVFNYKKEKIFEQRIAPSASRPKLVKLDSDQFGIGFCFSDSEQLILFDSNGETVEGFPLSGTSLFDLINVKDRIIVCSSGGENTVTIQTID